MTPYEILLSESQERMLLVAKPGKEARVLEICARWDLDAAVIGKVTETKRWVVKATPGYDPLASATSERSPVVVCDIPIGILTDGAPVYSRPCAAPRAAVTAVDTATIPVPSDLARELLDLIGSPNVGSRAWIWRQYDQIVRGGTVVRPGSDAAVVRVPCGVGGLQKFLAFAVDCNGRTCELDPYVGGASAIAEVCRNLVATGAEPIGITDCLNFGNPERPEVMDTFVRAIEGLAAACKALGVPIVSGNVSLYNETTVERDGVSTSLAILPTPTVAAVGLLRSADDVVTTPFKRTGDAILLLGDAVSTGARALGASEWLVRKLGKLVGEAPLIDLAAEVRLQKLVLALARAQRIASAHDVSDGGLAVALAESCAVDAAAGTVIGARVKLPSKHGTNPIDVLGTLFGEGPSRIVVTVPPEGAPALLEEAAAVGVPATLLGTTGGDVLAIDAAPLGSLSVSVRELRARADACLTPIVGD